MGRRKNYKLPSGRRGAAQAKKWALKELLSMEKPGRLGCYALRLAQAMGELLEVKFELPNDGETVTVLTTASKRPLPEAPVCSPVDGISGLGGCAVADPQAKRRRISGKQPPGPDGADACTDAAAHKIGGPLRVQTLVRPMREEDIGAVADLFDEFVEDHRERCDEEVSDPAVWYTALGVPHGPGNRAKRILQRWLDHDKHFVMVSEVLPMGKVTGFVHMQAKEEKGKETLTVEHLKVSNKHEKKGVGRMLLAHAEKQAEEMALNASSLVMMTLLCVSSNSRAKNFYQQAGWKPSHSCNCSCGRCPEDWLLNSWVCPEIWRDGEDPCDADVTFLAMQKQVGHTLDLCSRPEKF